MENFFSVSTNRLHDMSEREAVLFFHALLHAEAVLATGVDKSKISVPQAITVPDGGIDADVRDANPGTNSQGVIKPGNTAYQIKTGDFWVHTLGTAREIIQKDTSRGQPKQFKTRVKTCLENGDTLVVVLFGTDNPDATGSSVIAHLRSAIREVDPAFENSRIEVWNQNTLVGFLKPFPSLRIRLQQRPLQDVYDLDGWGKLGDMGNPMYLGEPQTQLITSIRTAVESGQAEPIRVLGDPGIGKTRTTLEAVSIPEIAPLVVYVPMPSSIPDGFLAELVRSDNHDQLVLVVDECDLNDRYRISQALRAVLDRVKLVTIYNEQEPSPPDMIQVFGEPLPEEQIKEIFISPPYEIPEDVATRMIPLCGGSPKVAHVIAKDIKATGDVSIDHDEIWDRYIRGGDQLTDSELQKRKWVLQFVALFKRFGFGNPHQIEGRLIARKIQVATGITPTEFETIVRKMRSRKVLQGETTLYITPILLQISLWKQWWEEHGDNFELEDFIKIDEDTELNSQLVDWFFDMLIYGRAYPEASVIVDRILNENSLMEDPRFLDSERGSKLIRILSEVDQEAVLSFIKRTLNKMSDDEVRQFYAGRRGMVHALESIVMDPNYFKDAAEALIKLAKNENEHWSNNATGVFTGLFSNGPGAVAPTGATPEERFPVLQYVLTSSDKQIQKIGVSAASKGLEATHFSRIVGAEYYGLNGRFELWKPKTYGELWDAYRRIWSLLVKSLPNLAEENRIKAGKALIQSTRSLLLHLSIKEEIVGWIDELSKNELVSKKELLKEIVLILNYDQKQLSKGVVDKIKNIQSHLTGDGYSALLRRYAGMNIIEDEYDSEGKKISLLPDKLTELAKDSIQDPSLLENELNWLMSDEPENSLVFGFHLGQLDHSREWLPRIIVAQRKAGVDSNVSFMAGYIRALFHRSIEQWEDQLDKLAKDKVLRKRVPEITWRSGMTDKAMYRILNIIKSGDAKPDELGMFAYGSVLEALSPKAFQDALEFVSGSNASRADSIALNFASFYYAMKRKAPIPKSIGLKILTAPTLFEQLEDGSRRSQMDDYYWGQVAKLYIAEYSEQSLQIAKALIDHFGEHDTIIDSYRQEAAGVLAQIAKKHPREVWNMVLPYITPIRDSKGFNLMWWLTGGIDLGPPRRTGAISVFPPELLWEWVEDNVDKNAKEIASYVPQEITHDSLARELLMRYGDREDVMKALNANTFNEGWSGEASAHYRNKKTNLLKYKETESNKNVIDWINQYIKILDKQIERARIDEERNDF